MALTTYLISQASDHLTEKEVQLWLLLFRQSAKYKQYAWVYSDGLQAKIEATEGTIKARMLNALMKEIDDLGVGGTTFNWNFGNGSTSSSQHPNAQTYQTGGTYQVIFTSTSSSSISLALSIAFAFVARTKEIAPISKPFLKNSLLFFVYFVFESRMMGCMSILLLYQLLQSLHE